MMRKRWLACLATVLVLGTAPLRAQDLPDPAALAPPNPRAEEATRTGPGVPEGEPEARRGVGGAVRPGDVGHVAGGDGVPGLRARAGRAGAVPRDDREGHPVRPGAPAAQRPARREHQPRADVLPRHQHLDARRGRRHDPRPGAGRRVPRGPGQGGRADPEGPGRRQEQGERRRLAVSADQPRQRPQRHRLAGHGPARPSGPAAPCRPRTSTRPSPT